MGHPARSVTGTNLPVPSDEDMAFQRVQWRVERIGWTVLVLFLVLALAGVFAAGPLARATATDTAGRMLVDYPRFVRNGAAARLEVHVTPDGTGTFTLALDRAFMRAFTLSTVQPAPKLSRTGPQGIELTFGAAADGPGSVYITVTPQGVGVADTRIGVAGRGQAQLRQFIYP